MPGRANQVVQNDAISKVVELAPHSSEFKSHVRQVIVSPAFRGSRRSQQFLQFVVENALDGHFGELKERNLGIKLFDRSPSYNTADDAIVRVTACDVRKRLLQYYAEVDTGSEFRIELPPGSYIPELQRLPAAPAHPAPEPADDLVAHLLFSNWCRRQPTRGGYAALQTFLTLPGAPEAHIISPTKGRVTGSFRWHA